MFLVQSRIITTQYHFQVRESQGRVEELETANSHLQRRLDKLKNAKSALLKEL